MRPADYVLQSIIKDLLEYPLVIIQKGSPLIEAIDAMFEAAYENECFAIVQDLVQNGDSRYIKTEVLQGLYLILYHDDKIGLSMSHALRHRVLARTMTELSYEYCLPGKKHIVSHFTTMSELEGKVKACQYFGVTQYVWLGVCSFLAKETGCKHIEVIDWWVKRHGVYDCGIEIKAIYNYLLHTGRVVARQQGLLPDASSTILPGWDFIPEKGQ